MNLSEYLNKLSVIEQECIKVIASVNENEELSDIQNRFLGRKSELTALLRSIVKLNPEERGEAGKAANEIRTKIENLINQKLNATPENIKTLDVTIPGEKFSEGHLHLTTQAIKEITKIFEKIGFYKVRYPEVDWDWYAFTSLNFPHNHPARDDWETFFIDKTEQDPKLGKRVLTPHTSSGQVREMQTGRMPIRMINISKTYRRQIDISHTPMFHQFEGLLIDKGITIAHLKGVLDYFVKEFFGPDRKVRIRPYNFKFTEPSFEVDVSLPEGSKIGKNGWLEIGGAGMVHPKVLEAGGIDPKVYSGFAFGWGVERNKIVQKGIQIDDIRILYQNDIRFLKQF